MFQGPGLLVSLPATELRRTPPPASLFDLDTLKTLEISEALRIAIELVEFAAGGAGNRPLIFVARPEIFTNSTSLSWLNDQLDGIKDHLCISDGSAIRVIAGFRNHMFLYRLGVRRNAEAFAALKRRAPELISTIRSQINTAHGVDISGDWVLPAPRVLAPRQVTAGHPARRITSFFQLADTGHAPVSNRPAILAQGEIRAHELAACSQLVYVPLTETALDDARFMEAVAAMIARAIFDPSSAVILRLPDSASDTATTADRIDAFLASLRNAGASLPGAFVKNIVVTDVDLDEEWRSTDGPTPDMTPVATLDIVTHATFAFWRHSKTFYARARDITVHAPPSNRPDRTALRTILRRLLGRAPDLRGLTIDEATNIRRRAQ